MSVHAPELYLTSIKAATTGVQSYGTGADPHEWRTSAPYDSAPCCRCSERVSRRVSGGLLYEWQDERNLELSALNTWS